MNQLSAEQPVAILFVCLGNICRSPAAEAIFRRLAEQRGLAERFSLDSAGVGDYHIGAPPDSRAIRAGRAKGYSLEALRARQVCQDDFKRFDYLVAMDESNLRTLLSLREQEGGADLESEIELLLHYSDCSSRSVPDPYWGDDSDFSQMVELLESACAALLEHLLAKPGFAAAPR